MIIKLLKRTARIVSRSIQSKDQLAYYVNRANRTVKRYAAHQKNAFRGRVNKLNHSINRISSRARGSRDLIILDDIFPQPISAFRIAEYTYYLESFGSSRVYSTANAFKGVREKRSFGEVVREYESKHAHLKGRVLRYKPGTLLLGKVVYAVFLENAFGFIEQIEESRLPFVFTLYPGGAFQLNDEVSDAKLRRVLASPYFRKVIVTQNVTYQYLIDHNFCRESDIEFIFGVVLPTNTYRENPPEKKRYRQGKETFDACFVANRNMPRGEDKGYDKFIEAALILGEKYGNIHFHVVGPYDAQAMDVSPIAGRITFYGYLHTDRFKNFYATKDIIVSPNIHFKLVPGAFDGFPTGACTEAGLNGVALFVTDTLGQNIKFRDREDIVLIPHDSAKIADIVEEYYLDPEKTRILAENGQKRMQEVYSTEAQLGPRKAIITKLLKEIEND
jgi:glycosyltransferase involved in cell wall biosynthesis